MTDSIIKSLIGSSIILFLAACALMLPGCSQLSQNTNTVSNYVNSANISTQNKQPVVSSHSDENYDDQIREQANHSDGYGNTYITETGSAIHASAKTASTTIQ